MGPLCGPYVEWSPAGGAIYYESGSGLTGVTVEGGDGEIELGTRRTIELDLRYAPMSRFRNPRFRVGGETILTLAATEARSEEPIRIVRHWRGLLEGGAS